MCKIERQRKQRRCIFISSNNKRWAKVSEEVKGYGVDWRLDTGIRRLNKNKMQRKKKEQQSEQILKMLSGSYGVRRKDKKKGKT